MKLLTATARTQGDHPGDFCFTVEGELVYLGFVCMTDRSTDPEGGGCGCGRSFSGLDSRSGTTTAMVRDVALSRRDLLDAVAAGLDQAGFGRDGAQEVADEMVTVSGPFTIGSIVERRGPRVKIRRRAVAA